MSAPPSPADDDPGSDGPIPIAEGIAISPSGEVRVDEGLTETLLDLAEALEERTGRPVDVEHVVAAAVLANRAGKIGSDRRLRTGDDLLLMALIPQIDAVFTRYGGLVAEPDGDAEPGQEAAGTNEAPDAAPAPQDEPADD
ncbi:hypothetical protein [Alienimonas chondri]|uniref:Uncharacterized protein n=1 Tax=Alienimonas chondri TaxID=2681879 RepID=A0ABX1VAK7_9PLAN|nr:hypothetical protein [Alienimonas chondri]NNJ24956.1 hypothetical protein [Alienimonas chondri]